jgi:OOP family OmpA-OmpF porin
LYSPVEHNKTTHANLGIARAEAIKSFLTSAGAPPENIQCEGLEVNNIMLIEDKIYGGVYFRFSQDATTEKRTAESEEVQGEKSQTLSEKPAGNVQYIRFRAGSYKLNDSDERTLPMLDRLVAASKKRTSDKIIITGFSEKEEDAATSVKLAEARARSIRRYLVDNGVRRSQIQLKFKTGLSDSSAKGRAEITVEK